MSGGQLSGGGVNCRGSIVGGSIVAVPIEYTLIASLTIPSFLVNMAGEGASAKDTELNAAGLAGMICFYLLIFVSGLVANRFKIRNYYFK